MITRKKNIILAFLYAANMTSIVRPSDTNQCYTMIKNCCNALLNCIVDTSHHDTSSHRPTYSTPQQTAFSTPRYQNTMTQEPDTIAVIDTEMANPVTTIAVAVAANNVSQAVSNSTFDQTAQAINTIIDAPVITNMPRMSRETLLASASSSAAAAAATAAAAQPSYEPCMDPMTGSMHHPSLANGHIATIQAYDPKGNLVPMVVPMFSWNLTSSPSTDTHNPNGISVQNNDTTNNSSRLQTRTNTPRSEHSYTSQTRQVSRATTPRSQDLSSRTMTSCKPSSSDNSFNQTHSKFTWTPSSTATYRSNSSRFNSFSDNDSIS